jgi:hypothetical protein
MHWGRFDHERPWVELQESSLLTSMIYRHKISGDKIQNHAQISWALSQSATIARQNSFTLPPNPPINTVQRMRGFIGTWRGGGAMWCLHASSSSELLCHVMPCVTDYNAKYLDWWLWCFTRICSNRLFIVFPLPKMRELFISLFCILDCTIWMLFFL